VARNLYSSWGSVIIFVRVLLFLSDSFPHIALRQSFARPRLAALGLIASVLLYLLYLSDWFSISLFVRQTSKPRGIATSIYFQIQNLVYISCEQAAFPSFRVISSNIIFTQFMNLQIPIPLLQVQPHFLNDPRTYQGPLFVCRMTAFSCI
jgi:hypothetical protein